ncbi:MAG: CHAD domain-containing protein [Sphingomonadaceae bacterium]|nr:CHAD domain-containing protein [Sphingomonadaceae bacterium]
MTIETELKLEVEPDAAAFLEASELLRAAPEIVKQRALYFDTADKALLSAGISLRIRRTGRKRVQTLKIAAGPVAGLFARTEFERPVSDDDPVIESASPLAEILGKKAKALAPAFEILIERRSWMLKEGNADIECVIDRGKAKIANREASICEMELELKSGDQRELFSLARKFDQIAPVRLGMLSKAERGYGLLGPAISAHKAEPVMLGTDVMAQDAFQQIALACVRHYRLNEAMLFEDWHPSALHQARVALRRLRSAFTIFNPILPHARADQFKSALRDLSAVLGEARNLDVLRDRIAVTPEPKIEDARNLAYAEVKTRLASAETRALMLDLTEWLAVGDWLTEASTHEERHLPSKVFAAHALRGLCKKIRKHGRRLREGSDDDRHTVRKDAKKLRYASEFFECFYDTGRQKRRHGKFTKALEKLQGHLGAFNDRVTALELIEAMGLEGQPAAGALLSGKTRGTLIKRADSAWDELIDLKPFWR